MSDHSRRTVLGGIAGALVVGGGAATTVMSGGARAQITGWSVSGDEVTTADGTISDVVVAVEAEAEYSGVQEDVTAAELIVDVNDGDPIMRRRFEVAETGSMGADAGSVSMSGEASATEGTPLSASDFAAPEEGGEEQFPLAINLTFVLYAGETVVRRETERGRADIVVVNEEEEQTVEVILGGSASAEIRS